MAMYALHHEWLHRAHRNKLDAWYVKLLRRTIKVKTTYIDRGKTNEWVYNQTNTSPLSNTLAERQCSYYAHVVRSPTSLIYQVCFGPGHQIRKLNNTRVGRPREHWTPRVETRILALLSDVGSRPANRHRLHELCHDRKRVKQALGVLRASERREDNMQDRYL